MVARPRHLAALALGGLLLGACSLSTSSEESGTASLINTAQGGVLRIGGEELRFDTTTCSAMPDRYVAVGVGTTGSEPFLVRVRAGGSVEVLYGTEDEIPGDDDVRRRTTLEPAELTADGAVIQGTARLTDNQAPEAAPVPAELEIRCR